MLVEIETNCGGCILCDELCPFEHNGGQWEGDFCNKGKAYSEKCKYCNQCIETLSGEYMCKNYFFCEIAKELMNFCNSEEKDITILSIGAYNVGVEMEFITA